MAGGSWDWLVDLLLGPLRGKLLDDVRRFIANPIEGLLTPLRQIRDRITGALWPLGWIGPVISSMISDMGDKVRFGLIATIPGAIWSIPGAISTARAVIQSLPHALISSFIGPIWAAVANVGAIPHSLLHGLHGPLWGMVGGIGAIPHALLGGLHGPLWGVSGGIRELATSGIGALTRPLWDILAQIGIGTTGMATLPNTMIGALTPLLISDQDVRHRMQDELWSNVVGLGMQISPELGSAMARGPTGAIRALGDQIVGSLTSGLTSIQSMILGQGTIAPEDAPTIGTRAFLTASALGASAHALSTAIELVHPLRYMGFHYLSGFLADMGSFSSISHALIGTVVDVGVAVPMRYYLQARTRVTVPTAGDLQGMHRKHTLTPAQFGKYMAYQGYSEEWIQNYIEYLPADPRLFDILRMAEAGFPVTSPPAAAIPTLEKMNIRAGGNPDWWLQMKFALAGYNWIDIPMLVDTVHRRETNSERNRLVTTASVNFRNGYMSEPQFRQELDAAGKTPKQIDWKVRAERLSALRDDILDLEKLFTDRYLKDLITYDDLIVAFTNIGIIPHKADILANRARIRKTPKPTDDTDKRAEKATREMQVAYSRMYKEQYRQNLITYEEYHNSLRAIRISEAVAWATVELERARRIGQSDRVAIKAEAQAATRTQAARQRLFRERFRAGVIDAGFYYDALINAGVVQAEARAIVDLEVVRIDAQAAAVATAEATAALVRTRAAYQRLYQAQYRAGLITTADYYDDLIVLGVDADLARATVDAEAVRYDAEISAIEEREAEATQRAAQRAQAKLERERYDAGLIDADQYLTGLLEIRVDPALARATVDLAEVARFDLIARAELKLEEKEALALQREQARLYTRRFHAGEITPAQLLDRLISIGIPDLLAETTVQLELEGRVDEAERVRDQLIIPALKAPWTIYVKRLKELLVAGEITIAEYTRELITSGLAEDVANLVVAATS